MGVLHPKEKKTPRRLSNTINLSEVGKKLTGHESVQGASGESFMAFQGCPPFPVQPSKVTRLPFDFFLHFVLGLHTIAQKQSQCVATAVTSMGCLHILNMSVEVSMPKCLLADSFPLGECVFMQRAFH